MYKNWKWHSTAQELEGVWRDRVTRLGAFSPFRPFLDLGCGGSVALFKALKFKAHNILGIFEKIGRFCQNNLVTLVA